MEKYLSNFWGKHNNTVAIDIGTYSIKVVEGSYSQNMVRINKLVDIPTPDDAFYDGQIINKEKIKEVISMTLKKEDIRTKNLTFTLESSNVINREIVLPWAKPQELKQMIEFEIEQFLPIEIDKYILQYKIINEFEDEGIKKVTVLVIALPKVISENYFDLAKELDLKPRYLDLHSNAVYKLLSLKTLINSDHPLEDQTIAIIDLGYQFINITIIDNGQFKFSRLLNNGGKDIDTNIANLFNLSLDEAENKKIGIKDMDYSKNLASSAMLVEIVKETVLDWANEIEKIFKYYTSRNPGNRIDTIYIYGGSSNIEGIPIYIQEFFHIPTFKIDELSNLKLSRDLEGKHILNYINAIGSIIRR